MVGGYPFNVDPELWQRFGADGHAKDAGEALNIAPGLLTVPDAGEQRGQKADPADILAGIRTDRETRQPQTEATVYGMMSRLNNELLTTQRDLARKNAQLE